MTENVNSASLPRYSAEWCIFCNLDSAPASAIARDTNTAAHGTRSSARSGGGGISNRAGGNGSLARSKEDVAGTGAEAKAAPFSDPFEGNFLCKLKGLNGKAVGGAAF